MLLKDATEGLRVNTKFGPGTVTGTTAGKYIELLLDKSIPGRQNMNDRTLQAAPRNVKPVVEKRP